ncbi:MAG: hypothetical protein BZ137_09225 [Methanosphaera sp. rholeuAM130]|nr:MAG: hypothetical protein BZ137_09225 [Methanosphaera sp. rholeuAM130]
MEILESIDDKLEWINEENIIYYNIFEHPELIYGNINLASHSLNFSKLPKSLHDAIANRKGLEDMENLSHSSYGTRLRFHTYAKKIIFKVEFKQEYTYPDIHYDNSNGFDVYILNNDEYIHKTTFSCKEENACFAEIIELEEDDNDICIFLPNFNTINQLFIGLKKGFSMDELPYLGHNRLPIIFSGDEYAIGKTATRSGNSYPNIVSKILDQNIINLSYYHMNKAEEYLATMIGKYNCECIVLDYNGKNTDKREYEESLENFYNTLRVFHPNKKIIILTSLLNEDEKYNEIICDFYNDKRANDEEIRLLDKKELLRNSSIDLENLNQGNDDEIMKIIARQICKLMRKY